MNIDLCMVMTPTFTDIERLRYSCQLNLPGFGEKGQLALKKASVLIIGAGGLGCPAALYLASAGIGRIGIVDFDAVSMSNLHRQVLYAPEDAGKKKALVAAAYLSRQNPHIQITPIVQKASPDNIMGLVESYDLTLDCTDNFEARYLINDACVLAGKPLVYGAIYQYEGQVSIWNAPNADGSRSPHYRDLFPSVNAAMVPNCAEGGVLPALAGIIGCIQANEAIKFLAGTGETLSGKILLFDALSMQSRIIRTGDKSRVVVSELPAGEDIPFVLAADFKKNGDMAARYRLIDVRKPEERAVFHIGGEHVPIDILEERAADLTQSKQPLLFYCASGKRSAEAVRIIRRHASNAEAWSLDGGLKAWQEA